nr:DUF6634 family protein [uncultured Devosia sp.]
MRFTYEDRSMAETARRIHSLSDDLKLIEQLMAPRIYDFATAPILNDWSIGQRHEIALVGRVEGHASIPDKKLVTTSGLYFLDPVAGYARTLSRWYRLGKPLEV